MFTQVEKAQVIQTMLFVSGVNTLLQTWFGTRLPVVIGGSFRFLIPSLYVAFSQRYILYLDPYRVSLQHLLTSLGFPCNCSINYLLTSQFCYHQEVYKDNEGNTRRSHGCFYTAYATWISGNLENCCEVGN